jgi:DNA primase
MLIEDWVLDRFPEATYSTTNLRVNCPFCGDDTGKHLYIQIYGDPVAHCFRCEWRGNIYSLVAEVDNISYGEAILLISVASLSRKRKVVQASSTPEGYISFSSNPSSTEATIVRRYLHSRNIPEATIQAYCGIVPQSWRAWFVFDNFWQGRLIRPGDPKYISAEKAKDDVIWNANALLGHRDIIICEGIISACNAGDNAIALLAKTATPEQLARIIKAAPKSILIMLDADAFAEAMVLMQNLMLEGYAGSIAIAKLAYGDPADCKEYKVLPNSFENRVKMLIDSGISIQSSQYAGIAAPSVKFPDFETLFLR